VPQRGDRALEEDVRGVEHDRKAEQELPDVTVDAERRRQLGTQQLGPDHRPEDDRDREDQRDEEAITHIAHHRVHRHSGMTTLAMSVRLLGALHRRVVVRHVLRHGGVRHRVANVTRHRLPGAVEAALLDPLPERLDGRPSWVECDRRGLTRRVCLDPEYTSSPAQDMLDDGLLGSKVQPPDVKDRRVTGRCSSRAHET
jgi:hypothetical protein